MANLSKSSDDNIAPKFKGAFARHPGFRAAAGRVTRRIYPATRDFSDFRTKIGALTPVFRRRSLRCLFGLIVEYRLTHVVISHPLADGRGDCDGGNDILYILGSYLQFLANSGSAPA